MSKIGKSIFNLSVGKGLWQSVCMCVCVCVLPRHLGEYFISLLVEPIAGKNISPSDKQLWRFLKKFLVAEKSQCKA